MKVIKVVWKDSLQPSTRAYPYRKHTTSRFKDGWITNIPGDNNIYKYQKSAFNAIDAYLGGSCKRADAEERMKEGIIIIGKKDGETA